MRKAQRRDFLFAAGALLATPLACLAQPAQKVRRIGFLSPDASSSVFGQRAREMFAASLRGLGYEEGKNLVIEWRWGEAKVETLPALAEELVRLKVELIVARTNDPITAAKRATRTIPIVMLNSNHPVEMGLIPSLAHPGGNITGTSYATPELIEKQIQLVKEIAPSAVRVAIVWAEGSGDTGVAIMVDSLDRVADRAGMKLQYFDVSARGEVKAVLDRIAASHIDALWVSGSPLARAHQDEIAAFALKQKLVSVGAIPTYAEIGGLLTYSPDTKESFDRTASYVDRILKGAKPADLPAEQPTRFNLVINLKTAEALGIKIPQSLLVRADRVIE